MLQLLELCTIQEQLIKAQNEKIRLLEELNKIQEKEIEKLNNVIKLEKCYQKGEKNEK